MDRIHSTVIVKIDAEINDANILSQPQEKKESYLARKVSDNVVVTFREGKVRLKNKVTSIFHNFLE